jgi:hypothetical protein
MLKYIIHTHLMHQYLANLLNTLILSARSLQCREKAFNGFTRHIGIHEGLNEGLLNKAIFPLLAVAEELHISTYVMI